MKNKKIFVSGGAGFLGINLIEELLRNENEIVVLDNGFRAGFDNISTLKNHLSIIDGSVTDNESWKKVPKDIDFALHLAAINGTKYFYEIPQLVLEVNVQGTLNFMNWVKDTSASKIFFASSSEVYGIPKIFPTPETEPLLVPDPQNARFSYSSSKLVGETITINFARKFGIDYSIARFHNVYGPRMGFEHVIPEFIRKCVKNETFTVQGNGKETRSFCYISDAIEGIILTCDHSLARNEIFNIGTNEEVSINELIIKLEKTHGKKISPVYTEFKNAGTPRRIPDISKIKKLGYKQKISLEEGLKKTYEWYSNYYTTH